MSSKRRQRELKREDGHRGGPSLLRRSRELGGRRFGYPALIAVIVAFLLWLIFDLLGVHL